ncbi:MAG: phosphatidylserine/phosphatidylglycerophosphate/cardiolipin synthase family protein [Stigonema ocellatum SAG 48.90 = DSM 106950]|nr:phosphatidylserine/phosphatidylglycerophosphate/cardiolipin synthase family protein [Stigonema ocellatum SAG 48.90 = DSM 106950]
MAINVTFLKEGEAGQAIKVANQLAEFISAAKSNLHIAIYDFRLKDPKTYQPVINALTDRANAGVEVKIGYYAGRPTGSTHKGEKSAVVEMNMDQFVEVGGDPAPADIGDFLSNPPKNIQVKGIVGQKLMHNKYVVRDIHTGNGTLWTGSANFTDDAWSFQENNIVQIQSPELCLFYETDFQELWVKGNIQSTGVGDTGTVTVGQNAVDFGFSPGEGETIDQKISSLISSARRRIKVSSMVLTSRAILGALEEAIQFQQVKDFSGIYDLTQMGHIVKVWKKSPKNSSIISTFEEVASHLVGKHSTPYSPKGKHDFMHNKVVVCDDAVVTGSFNFSHNATQNSENMLILHSKALADQYAAYIDERTEYYGKHKGVGV